MKHFAFTPVLLALTLAACAPAAPPPLTLKQACDQLGVIAREFGQVQPDAARFAEYTPKMAAVVAAAEPTAQTVLTPYVRAMESGDVWKLAGVSIGLVPICTGAGSTEWQPRS